MKVAKRLLVSCHAKNGQAIDETLTVGARESQVKLAKKNRHDVSLIGST